MKKAVRTIIGLLVFACLQACTNNSPSALSIQPKETVIRAGEVAVLSLSDGTKQIPSSAAQWSATDTSVVYVSAGVIQGLREGMVIVTAEYKKAKAECIVTVGEGTGSKKDLSSAVRYLSKSAKRGVGYSFGQFPKEDVAALAPFICWCYNWGTNPSSPEISDLLDAAKIDYFPMAWNGVNAQQIRSYKQTHPQCAYILAFNEPNLRDQANMTPSEAAAKWPELKALADELGLKIVSPAMNYGTLAGYSDPVKWMDEFFQLVPKTDVCAIALHCYMASAGAMHSYIHKFDKYGLPVWMTEFCAWDKPSPSSMQGQIDYMSEALIMLEADPKVERYAWFIPRAGGAVDSYPYMQLLSKTDIGALSPQGEVFAALSSLDKSTWLPCSAPILPNTYCNSSAAEAVRKGSFEEAPHLRPTTDNAGVLMLTGFRENQWLEYQVDAETDIKQFVIRYQGVVGSKLTVLVDGVEQAQLSLPWNDMKWAEQETAIAMPAGKHTVRLVSGGNITFNWIQFL